MEVTFKSNKKDVLSAFEKQLSLGLWAVGAKAETNAKRKCPVDTGLLRNSITHAVDGEAPNISTYEADKGRGNKEKEKGYYSGILPKDSGDVRSVYIGTNVEYAQEVEYFDVPHNPPGEAHFLKNAAANYGNQYKSILDAFMRG